MNREYLEEKFPDKNDTRRSARVNMTTPVMFQMVTTRSKQKKLIYLIGSLRDHTIGTIGTSLRSSDIDIHDDWWSAGREADDYWRDHQQQKGLTYKEALAGPAAQHVFNFDKKYLDKADACVMVMPAGKSCHLEFGYMIGQGKPGWIYFREEPERFDVMTNFATDIFFNLDELKEAIECELLTLGQ